MTTLLTLAAMFSAIATTTPRVSYSSKLDIWMVFCVIFVFGTLMEFSLLIFLQKQIFAPKVSENTKTQLAEENLTKRSKDEKLLYTGFTGMLQGFQKSIFQNPTNWGIESTS